MTDREKTQVEILYDSFEKDIKYIKGFTKRTIETYRECFDRWTKYVGYVLPTDENLTDVIVGMKEKELSDVTINITVRSLNSFFKFLEEKKVIPHLKLKTVKEEKKVMRVFSDNEIASLLKFKPRLQGEWRLYCLMSLIMDTGARISEILSLETANVLLDDLLIKVYGKGRKERFCCISLEMRKIMVSYIKHRKMTVNTPYLFSTRDGKMLDYPNLHRDFKKLCLRVGVNRESIDGLWHSFRRKYAKTYIKNGGDVFALQQTMGHANLATTQTYVGQRELDELKGIHQKTSILSKLK
jgi:integrase/recombinase XerD